MSLCSHRIPLRATRKLYVDHIQETCTIEDLIFVFANHGQVNDAHLDGEGDLRYGIILFDTVNAAQSAVAELHNQIIRRLSDTRHPDPAKRRLVVKYRRESVSPFKIVQPNVTLIKKICIATLRTHASGKLQF